jgi:hypothetical protein
MKQEVFTELERLVELHSQGKSYPLTIHCFKLEYAVSEDS